LSLTPYVEPGSFIHSYMESLEDQETPVIYDFICACWCLSVAMGRSVIVDRPRAPVHLNMYVILVSESGIMRKSTSIRIATSVVRDFLQQYSPHVMLFENKTTMGMLLDELSRASQDHGAGQGVLVASELAAVLGRGSSLSGLPALLTDLYDCPDKRVGGGSLNTGSFNLKDVYFSFLGGSTPSWLAKAVRPEIIEGGFTSRCYFINGRNRKRSIAWPEGESDGTSKSALVEQLCKLFNISRRYNKIGITSGAKNTFSRWYNNRGLHKDAYRESFESREDSHILRFAGLFAINEDRWEINEHHITRSIDFVSNIKRAGTELFTGTEVGTRDVRLLHKVRDLLLSSGDAGVPLAGFHRSLRISGKHTMEVRALLQAMHELDLVKKYTVEKERGRPATVYVRTEYLANEQFLVDVMRKVGIDA
jgi:hypothetical protein